MKTIDKFLYFTGFVFQGASTFLILIFASYFFSISEFGTLSYLIALLFFFIQVTGLGIHFSALYYESKTNSNVFTFYHFINSLTSSFLISSVIYFSLSYYFDNTNELFNRFKIFILPIGVFSAVNKTFYMQINAKRMFGFYGGVTILKGVVVLIGIVISFIFKLSLIHYLYLTYLIPETVVFLINLSFSIFHFSKISFSRILTVFFIDFFYFVCGAFRTMCYTTTNK